MSPKLMFVFTDLGVGLLWILLALPLIARRIPRNALYGFRTPKTLSSDDVWYPANAYMGRGLYHCGRLLIAMGLLLFVAQPWLSFGTVSALSMAALLVPLVVTVVLSLAYLRRL